MGVNAYCGGQATKASFGAAAVCGDVPVGEWEKLKDSEWEELFAKQPQLAGFRR